MTDVLIARDQFRLGWQPHRPPEALPLGAAVDVLNLTSDRGTLRVREPRRLVDTLPAPARNLAAYSHHATSPTARLIADCAGQVYATNAEGQGWTDPLHLQTVLDTRRPSVFAQMHGDLLMADGVGPVRRWHGGSWISGVYTESGTGGNAPSILETARYTGSGVTTFTIEIITAGVRDDVTGETTARFRWTAEGSINSSGTKNVSPETALTAGVTLAWRRMTYAVGEVFKFRCLHATAVDAFTDRPFPPKVASLDFADAVASVGDLTRASDGGTNSNGWSTQWSANLLADTTDFNGDASADFTSTGLRGVCARTFTYAGGPTVGQQALALELIAPSTIGTYRGWAWAKQRLAPFSLSVYGSLELTFQILAGEQIGVGESRLYLELGTADAADKLAYVIPIDLADVSPNVAVTKTISLADIPASDRAALTHIAFAWYCAGVADADTRIPGYTYLPDNDLAYTLVIDRLAPTGGNPLLQPGEYSVVYSYAFYDGAGFDESPHATKARIDLTGQDLVSTLDITGYIDKAAGLQEGDRVYVYVKGPLDPDYQRVLVYDVEGTEREFSVQWDGSVPADVPILRPYLKAPPAGVHSLLLWRDRMLYLRDDDKLYVSNWGNPRTVPQLPDDDTNYPLYDEYGLTTRVGQDGGTCRGMAPLIEYALIFKDSSIWLFEGDTPSRFACNPLSLEHGCSTPRTIAVVPERMAIWLDTSGDVCAWTIGQQIRKLGEIAPEWGCPVGEYLRGIDPLRLSRAFACYHPPTNSYRLTIPGDGVCDGETLVCDLDGDAWWREDTAPNGASAWISEGDTPGLYAVDPQASSLYRLDGGSGAANEASISYRWASGEITSGDALQYLIPEHVRILCQRDSNEAVTVRLWANNGVGTPEVSETFTPEDRDLVSLRPPLLANCRSVRVGIAGSSSYGTEITAITLDLQPNGRLP